MATLNPMDLMRELEPAVESNLNRHLSVAQEWMPHEYVPWRLGRDFAGDVHLASRDERLDRHAALGVVLEKSVEDAVADLVGDLVGMAFGNRLRREQTARHGSSWYRRDRVGRRLCG